MASERASERAIHSASERAVLRRQCKLCSATVPPAGGEEEEQEDQGVDFEQM